MYTTPTASYQSSQRLHPLSLLAQMASRQASGCLQVTSGSHSWSIYLHHGRLTYASNSIDPFERLDRHLRRLAKQLPALVSAVRVQVRLLFDKSSETGSTLDADYQAICWLIEQDYLPLEQAALLIEELAKEVLETFLSLKEGAYTLLDLEEMAQSPTFCQLDLRPLVEHCQIQLRQRQSNPSSSPSSLLKSIHPSSSQPAQVDGVQRSPNLIQSNANPISGNLPDPALGSLSKTTYTIACIDDSPTVLHAIQSFLDDKIFKVLMIDNPVHALMQIVRNKPNLILLDVEMPNLDGYELCSLLRRHSTFKNTPIIMVTGNTGFVDRAKAKLVRASGYMTKPFTQSDLLKMVFKHLT